MRAFNSCLAALGFTSAVHEALLGAVEFLKNFQQSQKKLLRIPGGQPIFSQSSLIGGQGFYKLHANGNENMGFKIRPKTGLALPHCAFVAKSVENRSNWILCLTHPEKHVMVLLAVKVKRPVDVSKHQWLILKVRSKVQSFNGS